MYDGRDHVYDGRDHMYDGRDHMGDLDAGNMGLAIQTPARVMFRVRTHHKRIQIQGA